MVAPYSKDKFLKRADGPEVLNLADVTLIEEEIQIAHVLFMDVVGFSQNPNEEQKKLVQKLNRVVSSSAEFNAAQARGQLNCRPTGDGMALVFYGDVLTPVKCSLEIARTLKGCPEIKMRMGINSGPVCTVENIVKDRDVTGDGINMAQRVMDAGEAGHILLSASVAEALREKGGWSRFLHDLGIHEVKNRVRIHFFNLCTGELGNPKRPEKLKEKTRVISLAVLPLVNKSQNPNTEFLSDGITENIIFKLSQLPRLRVIARGTAFRYKGKEVDPREIKRDLKVRAMFTGSVLQLGEMLSISAELMDLTRDMQLWGERYNRKPADIFALQEDVSREITEKLRLKLTGEEQKQLAKRSTEDPEAFRAYLKGRYYWNKRSADGLQKGIKYFNEAIAIDPGYALAYAGLADCYNLISNCGVMSPRESSPKARAAALKALEIDDTLAEAHTSLARRMAFDWDWPGAEAEYKRAIELNVNYATAHHWYGVMLRSTGRHAEALYQIKMAQELDPLSLVINTDLGMQLFLMGNYRQAVEQLHKTLEIEPSFTPAHYRLGRTYEQLGMHEEALAEFQQTTTLCGGDPEPLLGHLYAIQGRREEAEKVADSLIELSRKRYVSGYGIAAIYVGLGENERAMQWLEKAYEERDGGLLMLKVEPLWEGLNSHAGFQSLLRRINLLA